MYYFFIAVLIVSPIVFALIFNRLILENQGKKPYKTNPVILMLIAFASGIGTTQFSDRSFEYSAAIAEAFIYFSSSIGIIVYGLWISSKRDNGKTAEEK